MLVSGLFFSGIPRRIYLEWTQGGFVGALTTEILAEYRRVSLDFVRRGHDAQVESALDLIVQNSLRIEVRKPFRRWCRDPDDDKFLACAVATNADCIVTGDRDLLVLRDEVPCPILTPREFLAELRLDE